MTTLHNPPHPGEVLRDGVFADKGLTVTDFAKRLGVTRVALSRVLNGKAAISADMAVRLAAALGGSDESWLHLQANHDLWRARRALRTKVAKIVRIDDVAARRKSNPHVGSDFENLLAEEGRLQESTALAIKRVRME